MIVNFTKMHGLGNDFVIIDLITQGARLKTSHIRKIADRKFGIGCDQVILISPPTKKEVDFFYTVYNADGTEVEQCGNGVRCAAKFFVNNGLTNKNHVMADCLGGTLAITIQDNQQVSVNWGKNYTPVETKTLSYPDMPNEIHCVSTGNPHGVCIVNDLSSTPIGEWGKILSTDPLFAKGANIGFMQIIDRQNINLRVYERGVGPTLACGSGACAAMLVAKALNLVDSAVKVSFEYGDLLISVGDNGSLLMEGPANSVYIGRFKI